MTLRDAIHAKHTAAEVHPFAQLMLSGGMGSRTYATFLHDCIECYASLESRATQLGLLSGLEDMKRESALLQDFAELGDPLAPPALSASAVEYSEYVKDLPAEKILAHIYVRHMGDMYGGQLMKSKLPGQGKRFEFANRSELVAKLRAKLTDDMADEANVAFDYVLKHFDDLTASAA